ncbi:MAG: rRNA maturation RNase YbeY [Spirochaetia bacterium]|nr:rRNA maturation RNase YbeY [Spirochaetia bacterium]
MKSMKKKPASENRAYIHYNKKRFKPGFDPERAVLDIAAAEGKKSLDINVVFTDNNHIKRINLEYRQKAYATDVISFPFMAPGGRHLHGGDIFISVDKAVQQAAEYGETPGGEIQRLLVHGVLHVLGYDHVSKADEKKMRPKERKYLKMIQAAGK